MTQEEAKIVVDGIVDGVDCAISTVYETLSILFEGVANQLIARNQSVTPEALLLILSQTLKQMVAEKETARNERMENKKNSDLQ